MSPVRKFSAMPLRSNARLMDKLVNLPFSLKIGLTVAVFFIVVVYLLLGRKVKKPVKSAQGKSKPVSTKKLRRPPPAPAPPVPLAPLSTISEEKNLANPESKKLQVEIERARARQWAAEVLPKTIQTTPNSPSRSPVTANGKSNKTSAAKKETIIFDPSPSIAIKSAKFILGHIVTVAYRSEKGEPTRPGGEAKVTSVDSIDGNWVYNVQYFQGGREMRVAEKYLSDETSLTSVGEKRSRATSQSGPSPTGKKSRK